MATPTGQHPHRVDTSVVAYLRTLTVLERLELNDAAAATILALRPSLLERGSRHPREREK